MYVCECLREDVHAQCPQRLRGSWGSLEQLQIIFSCSKLGARNKIQASYKSRKLSQTSDSCSAPTINSHSIQTIMQQETSLIWFVFLILSNGVEYVRVIDSIHGGQKHEIWSLSYRPS